MSPHASIAQGLHVLCLCPRHIVGKRQVLAGLEQGRDGRIFATVSGKGGTSPDPSCTATCIRIQVLSQEARERADVAAYVSAIRASWAASKPSSVAAAWRARAYAGLAASVPSQAVDWVTQKGVEVTPLATLGGCDVWCASFSVDALGGELAAAERSIREG